MELSFFKLFTEWNSHRKCTYGDNKITSRPVLREGILDIDKVAGKL